MFKIVADSAIVWLDKLFAQHGEITRYSGREINKQTLQDVDLLLTRSTVKIDEALLENTSVKLVASATVGCDHVNQKELQGLGIKFAHAPGCNGNAVSEYVVSAIAWHEKRGIISFDQNLTAAVIGCGQIGSKVKEKLEVLGFNVVINDPPLENKNTSLNKNLGVIPTEVGIYENQRFKDYKFVDLYEALQADVICMHTPLTRSGDHPTFHLIDKPELQQTNPNAILINAGRGEVINNSALLGMLADGSNINVVLDVWENEPNINQALLNKINLATPHIAGHSWRGKLMGTVMIYQQACDFFSWQQQLINQSDFKMSLQPLMLTKDLSLYDVVAKCYDIENDTAILQSVETEQLTQTTTERFDQFRKNYYKRPEFSDLKCHGEGILLGAKIKALGFDII